MSKNGYTGGLLEADYLYGDQRIVKRGFEDVEYENTRDAVKSCLSYDTKKNPNAYRDPEYNSDPPSKWLNDVHALVAEKVSPENYENLKIFPAVGSSADIHHGIDAFFVYTDPKTGKQAMVTIDLSLRKRKAFKADLKVSDTSAESNYFYDAAGYDINDIQGLSSKKFKEMEDERKERLAQTIVEIIHQKLKEGDPNYESSIYRSLESLKTDTRNKISDTL